MKLDQINLLLRHGENVQHVLCKMLGGKFRILTFPVSFLKLFTNSNPKSKVLYCADMSQLVLCTASSSLIRNNNNAAGVCSLQVSTL
jgi:hypothetical protein